MRLVKSNCPACGMSFEIPGDFDSVICASCGASYNVLRHEGSISLVAAAPIQTAVPEPDRFGDFTTAQARLAELTQEIDALGSEVEAVKSKELGAPLQKGCAVFGLFGVVVLVMAFFMTVARSYFGGWLFYLALAVAVLSALKRMLSRLASRDHVAALRARRSRLETELARSQDERADLRRVMEKRWPQAAFKENGGQ